jgi:hypothetical protein
MKACKFATVVNQGQTPGMAEAAGEICVELVPRCPQA